MQQGIADNCQLQRHLQADLFSALQRCKIPKKNFKFSVYQFAALDFENFCIIQDEKNPPGFFLRNASRRIGIVSYLAIFRDLRLGHVLQGYMKAVRVPDTSIDHTKAALPKNRSNLVFPLKDPVASSNVSWGRRMARP